MSGERIPAVILLHTSHTPVLDVPPPGDPRHQDVLPDDRAHVADAVYAVEVLAGRLGSFRRLHTILRNVAHIHGEEV